MAIWEHALNASKRPDRVSYRGRVAPGFPPQLEFPPPPEIVTILYDYDAM